MRQIVVLAFIVILGACVVTPTPPPPTPTPPQSPISPIATPAPIPLAATPPALPAQPISQTYVLTNVLVNGGMNLPYSQMPGYSTISLPRGWLVGWKQHPDCTHNNPPGCSPIIACPINCVLPGGNCSNDEGCYWAMPETTRVLSVEYEGLRTKEGDASAKAFTVGRMGAWWYYQSAEVGAGNILTFSAYLQAWMCFDYANCSKGQRSDLPTAMHLRVGIDPLGGHVVTSTNVIWSPEGDAYRIDKNSTEIWKRMSVSAMAGARTATVFIYASPDWSLPATDFPALYDGNHARQNNDLYVDDAQLAVQVLYPVFRIYLPLIRKP